MSMEKALSNMLEKEELTLTGYYYLMSVYRQTQKDGEIKK